MEFSTSTNETEDLPDTDSSRADVPVEPKNPSSLRTSAEFASVVLGRIARIVDLVVAEVNDGSNRRFENKSGAQAQRLV